MKKRNHRGRAIAAALAAGALAAGVVAASGTASGATNWSNITSAKAGGGMAALVAAAKKEGTLNLIADPFNWANYGEIITSFSKKYGIHVNDVNKLGTSQEEITALQTLGGQSRAPDAVDVGQSYALDNASLFAPYKVATWSMIPAANKAANGTWANDYGGYVSIGCNTSIVKVCPTSFAQLTNAAYKNDVALDNSPVTANSAFSAVWAAALANGGSFDNIAPGITFFQKLHQEGNFVETPGLPGAIASGQTPIVIDWDYNNAAAAVANKGKFKWTTAVPIGRVVRRVLRAGDQREGPAPGRSAPVARVPVLGNRSEPLAQGALPARRAAGDDQERDGQQHLPQGAAGGIQAGPVPVAGPGDRR